MKHFKIFSVRHLEGKKEKQKKRKASKTTFIKIWNLATPVATKEFNAMADWILEGT